MSFNMLWEGYKEDLKYRIKESRWGTRISIGDTRILPFFKDTLINKVDESMIMKWQNWICDMRNSRGNLTPKLNQSTISNHVVTYYKLPYDPTHRTRSVGLKHAEKMEFWKLYESNQFITNFKDDPLYNHVYNLLFCTEMRQGENVGFNFRWF